MGLLRLILAAMVVFVHAGALPGLPTMGGNIAVQTFYIMSGFYMALILNEKYTTQPRAYRLFLTNRLLRLLPIYYVVVSLTLLVAIVMGLTLGAPELEFFRILRDNGDRLAPSTLAFLALSNLTLIGQDWLSFLSVDPATGTLVFTGNFEQSAVNLNSFLLVQPAWTVSLELTFYLLAPLLVRRRIGVLLLIIALSAGLRVGLREVAQLDGMGWSYRFFPFELMYFVAGALCCKAYDLLKTRRLPTWLPPAATALILFYTLSFGLIHQQLTAAGLPGGLSSAIYRVLIVGGLPLVFLHTRHSRLDTRIGELSYPVYLIHFLVWETLTIYGVRGAYVNLLTLAVSIGLALLINYIVGQRVERVRQRVSAGTLQPLAG